MQKGELPRSPFLYFSFLPLSDILNKIYILREDGTKCKKSLY